MKTDAYQEITDRIIEALETGAAPWLKRWSDRPAATLGLPHNASSMTSYNGVNVLLLWIEADKRGYNADGWMTYKQAQAKGAQVRKGEKGTRICFFKPLNVTDKDTGEEKKVPMLRTFTVFNIEQIDGLEYEAPDAANTDISDILELAQAIGASVQHGGNKAFFMPSRDMIQMPTIEQFHGEHHYHATLAHELTHWTGHKSRLNRDLTGRFGDESYAMEELVAELGAAFICAQYGIDNEDLRHAGYIESWLKVLKNDKRAVFTASSKARQAVEWVGETLISCDLPVAA